MRIISIDVGIKNLAYCILEQDDTKMNYRVIHWDVINLCGEVPLCNCSLKPKVVKGKKKQTGLEDNKNATITTCNKKATYMKVIDVSNSNSNTIYYCQVHAKQSDYIIPDNSLKKFKSWKRDVLISYAASKNIVLPINVTITKDILIKHIGDYLKNKMLERISSVSANEMTLIQMGVKLVTEFDRVLSNNILLNDMALLDHIIIENQISPIANRMKTLQGMIAQYFIMRDKPNISFISSANKLKTFAKEKTIDVSEDKNKNSYDERKKEGVRIVKELLEENKIISNNAINWLEHFSSHKKKDDLADAFLQGAWFLSTNLLSAKQVGKG